MTPQQKLNVAYNEFIVDFVEQHGECQATRDEAHERADLLSKLAKDVVTLFDKHALDLSNIDHVIEAIPEVEPEDAYLVACAVAVAIEEAK